MFSNKYLGINVLVTGHNGFKGSWLVTWLSMLGARVIGISLPLESSPNHWSLLDVECKSHYLDIRNEESLRAVIRDAQPDLVFHLAAQPLVRRSYRQPLDTWGVNVVGTANVLDACRQVERLAGIIVVTTDKCYENKEWVWGYRETDRLGGYDPYSASKAGAEFVVASYRKSFFNTYGSALLASARAGNVIGGGDWSEDRLVPDLVRAVASGKRLEIRSPRATRPWQHVLECLSGYLMLGQQLLEGNASCADAWNFGPDQKGNRPVEDVLLALKAKWPAIQWNYTTEPQPHEAQLLYLDSSKAREKLGWGPVWTFEQAVSATTEWYRAWLDRGDVITTDQIKEYVTQAADQGFSWVDGGFS